MIILIFVTRRRASELAYTPLHCVTSLTPPLVDANTIFISELGLSETLEKILTALTTLPKNVRGAGSPFTSRPNWVD